MYVCNITPWLTQTLFMLIKVFCVCEHAEQASSRGVFEGGGGRGEGEATGLLNEGGGSNRLSVEFPQVQTNSHEWHFFCMSRIWWSSNKSPPLKGITKIIACNS